MSTPPPSLHSFTCPTCGAPLEVHPDEPTIHCQYCNATMDNPEYIHPQPSTSPVVIQADHAFETRNATPRSSRAGLFLIAGVAVFLIAGGAFLVSWLLSGSGLNLVPLQVHAPLLLIGSGSPAPNLIASTYNTNADSYSLARLDVNSHKVLWSALKQEDYLSIDAMVAGDTFLYLILGDRLVALQLSNGQAAWEATLPDKLYSGCTTCLLLEKGQVIVYTLDNSLEAYDALTGHQTWEKNFESAGYFLYPLGNSVGVLYTEANGAALEIFNPTDGTEITKIEPSCEPPDGFSDQPDNYSQMVFDSASQPTKVYFLFGLFNACVQRWDLSKGTIDWHYIEANQNLENSSDTPALLADGKLIYVQEDQLRSLDAITGALSQVIDTTKDYDLVPLAISGQYLIARAKRSSGSTRYELWSYNLETGQNMWKRPLVGSSPIDPPDEMAGFIDKEDSGFTIQVTSDGVWLITFQAAPYQVTLARINLETGELGSQKNLRLNIDSTLDFYDVPTRIPSQDNLAWFALEARDLCH